MTQPNPTDKQRADALDDRRKELEGQIKRLTKAAQTALMAMNAASFIGVFGTGNPYSKDRGLTDLAKQFDNDAKVLYDALYGDLVKKQNEPRPIPDYGDLMPVQEFVDSVESGGFIDYDGSGYYSDGKMMFESVKPSDIKGSRPKTYSHVIWFNR